MDKRGLELGLLDGLYQHFAFIQLLLVVLGFLDAGLILLHCFSFLISVPGISLVFLPLAGTASSECSDSYDQNCCL